jgi:hypothetical protein
MKAVLLVAAVGLSSVLLASSASADSIAETAGRLADRAHGLARRVQMQLGDARQGSDREAAACYDNALSQINSTARHLEHYRNSLRDGGDRRHRAMIRTFTRRLAELDELAARCGGADAPLPGQTVVEVTVVRADRPVLVHSYRMPARNAARRD